MNPDALAVAASVDPMIPADDPAAAGAAAFRAVVGLDALTVIAKARALAARPLNTAIAVDSRWAHQTAAAARAANAAAAAYVTLVDLHETDNRWAHPVIGWPDELEHSLSLFRSLLAMVCADIAAAATERAAVADLAETLADL